MYTHFRQMFGFILMFEISNKCTGLNFSSALPCHLAFLDFHYFPLFQTKRSSNPSHVRPVFQETALKNKREDLASVVALNLVLWYCIISLILLLLLLLKS